MDIIEARLSILQSEEFQIQSNERTYKILLQRDQQKIHFTAFVDLSQLKWTSSFSIEQLYKIKSIFIDIQTLEKSFEYISNIFKSNRFEVNINDQKMLLSFSEYSFGVKIGFDIILQQQAINSFEAIEALCQAIISIRQSNQQLQEKIDNTIQVQGKEQLSILTNQQSRIDDLEKMIQVTFRNQENRNQEMEIKINKLEVQLASKEKFSNILYKKDIQTINKWLEVGDKKMNLQLLYRASYDGFETEKFHSKCLSKGQTLVLIKSTNKRRFGGLTEQQWVNSSQYVSSNPSKTFIFSLDLNTKYTSNVPNNTQAIYCQSDYFAFGSGHDIQVNSKSNTNYNSYTNTPSTYGKNEGLNNNTTLAGSYNFSASEIEVFLVQLE